MVLAVHLPLVAVLALAVRGDVDGPALVALVLLVTVAGSAVLLARLRQRLRPIDEASRRLRRYLHLGVLDRGGPYQRDELGRLLRELDEVCGRLDAARRAAERAAMVDHVTGALTRGATEAGLADLARQVRRRDDHLTVALVDIDHFKSVNDDLGHAAGDAALHHAADVLGRSLRGVGLVGRWGGDELLVAVRGRSSEVSAGLERARRTVADRLTAVLGRRVTVSVGLAELGPADAIGRCVALADNALYLAKARGRDQLVDAGGSVLLG
jgi:diguanylate cyclase (GGDEF)-like protein